MKKIFSAAIALAMVLPAATPAMADPPRHQNGRYDNNRHDNDRRDIRHDDRRAGPAYSRYQPNPFRKGQRFEQRRAPNYRVIDYRRYHRLHAPPRGYRWVQSGNDALLVGIATGVIASVVAGTFN
ncbi:MAG: hypothetical protein ABT11_08765 [Novosphingobium sp. SCN 66-18]|nr:MAG: hypothetical protein ABT11_08765 [Novosphingobium sp. SCN 66-18]